VTAPCADLVDFVDGELAPDRADAFREHLRTCATCPAALLEAMQLNARLSTLTALPEPVAAPARARVRVRWKPWAGAGTAITALAAVAAVVLISPGRPAEPPRVAQNPWADIKTSPFDRRFAYPDASSWREPPAPMRGTAPVREDIPASALQALDDRNDRHGLAIAHLWNSVAPDRVASDLRKLEATPAVRNDLAAVESLQTSRNNFEPILTELEALKRNDDPAVARAARWNYAVLLGELELPLSAAAAFDEIAAEREPGWSAEATKRAGAARTSAEAFHQAWEHAFTEGKQLLDHGTPVSADSLRAVPGLMRSYLYNAVRVAPDSARVRALARMAEALDPADHPVLVEYVQRVASLDFRRRAPLARAYAKLLKSQPLSAAEVRALTTTAPSPDVADIVIGAMVKLATTPTQFAALRALVKSTQDPWLEIVVAYTEASADGKRGDWIAAEAHVRAAEKLCPGTSSFPCLRLADGRAKILEKLHRVPEALEVLHTAIDEARRVGEWAHYRELLFPLADVERFNGSTAMARAYAGEVLRLYPAREECSDRSRAYQVLASAALLDVDGPAARAALMTATSCGATDLTAANSLADIGRLDPQPDDLPTLQSWLTTLRASDKLTPAERVFADTIEGRLLIEHAPADGVALLERSITKADAVPGDVTATKARASAYSVLVFEAARKHDDTRTLTLVARDLGLALPAACTVALNAEDERVAVAVRGADGKDRGSYEVVGQRRAGAWSVRADLAGTLTGCPHVQVMARATQQGLPRILPAALAWSYATGAKRGEPAPSPIAPRTLIVTNVMPPAALKLAALDATPPSNAATTRTLSGRQATPSRVLVEMADATEIQFHTHALMNVGVSDASHLVLSADADGHYALTAEAIRSRKLRAHPIVVLAACHSAQGAHYSHAPWSLPGAFVAAGARAVFAVATDVPDRASGPFFERVMALVRNGADPATALRDERGIALTADPKSWVADIVVFE